MFVVKLFEWLKPLAAELVVHFFKSDQYFCQQLFLLKPGQSCEAFGFPAYVQCFDNEVKGGCGGSVGCVYTTTYDEKELVVDEAAIDEDAAYLDELFLGTIPFAVFGRGFGVWYQEVLLEERDKNYCSGRGGGVAHRYRLAILSGPAFRHNPHHSF